MISLKIQCQTCKHFRADVETNNVCPAFPNGIPARILASRHDHRLPYPGDNGIRYEEAGPEQMAERERIQKEQFERWQAVKWSPIANNPPAT